MNIFLSILLLIGLAGHAESELSNHDKIKIIRQCQHKILINDFSVYDDIISWQQSYPDDPGPYLLRAAAMQNEMIDKEENLYDESFKSLSDTVKIVIQKYLEICSKKDSAVCYLYLGHMYGYRSFHEIHFGSTWSSIRNGYKAYDAYKKGLEVDSAFYDLYLGIGSFHYWKSANSGILRTIGFIKNEKEKGIREVKMAIDSSLVSQDPARIALIHIYINEKKYDSAILIEQQIDTELKTARAVRWPMANCYFYKRALGKASDLYWGLFQEQIKEPGNYYNVVEAAYYTIIATRDSVYPDRVDEVYDYLGEHYKLIPDEVLKRQKNKFKYLIKKE